MKIMTFVREHPVLNRLAKLGERHKLSVALALAIIATFALTALSLSMYYVNGFYRFDLSRPTYEKERSELAKPESQKVYDTTSPITKTAVSEFLKEFDERAKNLQAYGDFRDASLSDEDLLIVPPTQ